MNTVYLCLKSIVCHLLISIEMVDQDLTNHTIEDVLKSYCWCSRYFRQTLSQTAFSLCYFVPTTAHIIYRYKFVTRISNTKTLFTQRLLSEYTSVCSSWSRSFPVSRIVITNNFNLLMFIKQRIPYYGLIKLFSGLVTMCSPKRQLLLGYFSCITLHCTGSTPSVLSPIPFFPNF